MITPGTPPLQFVAVADGTLLDAVFADREDRREAARALTEGRMVVTDPALLDAPGTAVLRPWTPEPAGARVELPPPPPGPPGNGGASAGHPPRPAER